jgi:Outer membrane protein beta-barrel domain
VFNDRLIRAYSAKRPSDKEDFVRKISSLALLLLALSEPALAQSHVFVSGDVFADHKRFSGNSTDSTLNVTRAGGGAGVGYQATDRWDLRGEVEVGGTTTITRPLLPTVTAFQSRTRNRITAVSALAGFSPGTGSRVRFTVLGGVSFLHVKTQFDSIPSGLVVVPHTDIDNVVSATVGVEVPLRLSGHFSVVPALRMNAFTLRTSGMNGFAIRPGVAFRWIS